MPKAKHTNATTKCWSATPFDSSVEGLYADLASSKVLWAHAKHGGDRHLERGRTAGDRLITTPSNSYREVLLKLTETLDWIAEDVSPSAFQLLSSVIHDIQRLSGQNEPAGGVREEPKPKGRLEDHKIGRPRHWRPITVDGIVYASVTAAARATGMPYEKLRVATL